MISSEQKYIHSRCKFSFFRFGSFFFENFSYICLIQIPHIIGIFYGSPIPKWCFDFSTAVLILINTVCWNKIKCSQQTSQEYIIQMLSTLSDYNRPFPAPSSNTSGRTLLRQSTTNVGMCITVPPGLSKMSLMSWNVKLWMHDLACISPFASYINNVQTMNYSTWNSIPSVCFIDHGEKVSQSVSHSVIFSQY